jgi:T-complex protein 11
MDSQKRNFRGRTTLDIARETERFKGWVAQNDQVAYEINSQREAHNETEPPASHNQNKAVAARSYHRLPSGSPVPQKQLLPLIAHGSTCNITENTPQPKMLIPSCRHFTENVRSALMFAVSHPPVTASTLIELDLNWILHNINLRSDINFETDLHFMPVKGKRAEQKRKEAQEYWLALAAELQIHLHARLKCPPSLEDEESFTGESFTPRLGQMFTDLRELLETLVPDRDHASIAENLDVPFVMQQIENGVLDISRLAEWLASLLKSHCAPMRDEWADQMTQLIEEGAQISDMVLLVGGIEKLFSVLEAMKLVSLFIAFGVTTILIKHRTLQTIKFVPSVFSLWTTRYLFSKDFSQRELWMVRSIRGRAAIGTTKQSNGTYLGSFVRTLRRASRPTRA